jgi:hypothetical protein
MSTKGAEFVMQLICREDCRFHGWPPRKGYLIHIADSTQELLRLFQKVKIDKDIRSLQKGTILDDTLPDVQAFLESRNMQMQLHM